MSAIIRISLADRDGPDVDAVPETDLDTAPTLNFARRVIDRNFHISIPGVVTFKKAEEMQEVAAQAPIERLLIETDGPFLSPAPYRGKRNEPLYTLYTAARIAELREIDLGELASRTTTNCCSLFNYEFEC